MELFRKILGPLGLALILIGGVIYGIFYTSGSRAVIPLLLGLVCTIAAVTLNLRSSRSEASRRSTRLGLNAGASIVFFAAILIFLQTFSTRYNARFDTTSNRRFSLARQTENILADLEREIRFTCFFKETTTGKKELEDLLKEYRNSSSFIVYQFVDPDKDPVAARRYEIQSYGTIVVESGGLQEKIHEISEGEITNTILKVTRTDRKKICFVTGHGEKSIDDTDPEGINKLKEAILAENYEVEELLAMGEEDIPVDCEILVVAAAEKDLFPSERAAIARYLSEGGALLVLLEPILALPELYGLVEERGITIGDDVVIDRFGRVLAGNFLTPIVNQYSAHPITEGFAHASFFPQARSIGTRENPEGGAAVEIIASTGESAYAETDIDAILEEGKTQFEGEKDLAGPVGLAAVSTIPADTNAVNGSRRRGLNSRAVVFGDSDFASNSYLDLGGNKDLIMNTIGWLAEEEDLIAIRPKDELTQPVMLTARQGRIVFWLPVVLLPAAAGAAGIAVAVRRKRSP
ncbi:MAG TPA: hypothetical protein ENO08_06520 [Candidatus Eisenbacteria bacterium]|uniref:ABC-type uncharacterized transport system domain-containing protein n=1 Tax=Eiseniibacteriota bacterium TaxID=2212470 RepID=A0A7V2AVM3_UNCEI|nr:hypothetical protein [Candidatus Eisenbacteria bacterium]